MSVKSHYLSLYNRITKFDIPISKLTVFQRKMQRGHQRITRDEFGKQEGAMNKLGVLIVTDGKEIDHFFMKF